MHNTNPMNQYSTKRGTNSGCLVSLGYEYKSKDSRETATLSRPAFLAHGFSPSGSLRYGNGRAFGPSHF